MEWRGKKNLKIRIYLYVPIATVIVVFICFITTPPVRTQYSSLGNNLSLYFYYLATDVRENLPYEFAKCNQKLADKNLYKLYKNLSWQRLEKKIDFESHRYNTWVQLDFDGSVKKNFLEYWQTLRPIIQATYANIFPKKIDIKKPVVHFRCSDVPFIKYTNYHLPKRESVEWMSEKIKQRGYNEITLLACARHKKVEYADACLQYSNYYADIFEENGLKVTMECNSIIEDFTSMLYSPLLVSLNASSFSFMAGVSKDPDKYISCNMGAERKGVYYLQTSSDWLLDERPPLLHKDAGDYYNSSKIIKLLDKG